MYTCSISYQFVRLSDDQNGKIAFDQLISVLCSRQTSLTLIFWGCSIWSECFHSTVYTMPSCTLLEHLLFYFSPTNFPFFISILVRMRISVVLVVLRHIPHHLKRRRSMKLILKYHRCASCVLYRMFAYCGRSLTQIY